MTDALSYFAAKLAHETDASDVYAAQKDGERFVLVDVRAHPVMSEVGEAGTGGETDVAGADDGEGRGRGHATTCFLGVPS